MLSLVAPLPLIPLSAGIGTNRLPKGFQIVRQSRHYPKHERCIHVLSILRRAWKVNKNY